MSMQFMKNWVYKIKWALSLNSGNIGKIFKDLFSLLGFIATICTFEAQLLGTYKLTEVVKDLAAIWSLVVIMVLLVLKNRNPLSYEYTIKNSDIKVCLKVGDVLDSDSSIVIPTCTTFDTITQDEFISKDSIQGQFQEKVLKNDIKNLDLSLQGNLDENGYKGITVENKNVGKKQRYLIGTVSKVTYYNKHYYFLAIANVNNNGKVTDGCFDNITCALEGFWNFMAEHGHTENVAIPVIGTGKAGINGISREEIIKIIILSFLAFNQDKKITERLEIYIHPSDLIKKNINLKELGEYLYFKCKYSNMERNREHSGRPLS